ncbi:MAG: DUF29 domain-containing protein [Oscillatoria princeps RMCB-10]|jgi:hypothetical protein|nr:DUF29 domain-containing protein [Oscillatoria princeps RMCB-10]
MTQELTDLRASILEGRYGDALAIVDELEGMSKQAILRNIQSYLLVLLVHLIKNQVEQRLTGSWANSIRSSIREIKKLNLKDNKTSYYINSDQWKNVLEDVIEDAIAEASEEVMDGAYSPFELAEILDRPQVMETAQKFLALTYSHSAKELPAAVIEYLAKLPGGEDWINRRK